MKTLLYCGISSLLLGTACAPCPRVTIESSPPGAEISVIEPEVSGPAVPTERWTMLGLTPLSVSSCRLSDALRASWNGRDLFLYDYRGSQKVHFDFEDEISWEE